MDYMIEVNMKEVYLIEVNMKEEYLIEVNMNEVNTGEHDRGEYE
jgi:hypothetical protein